jgi:esterase/lipase superfamily enzyme
LTKWLLGPVIALWIGLAIISPARAQYVDFCNVDRANHHLNGKVVDLTFNHGADRRIFSPILGMRRDLYVYLPPGYDPNRAYSLIIFFHMANADEHFFVHSTLLKVLDRLIAAGAFPPVVVAAPDGLFGAAGRFHREHSMFINGPNGRFEDHIIQEVIPFLTANYSIRPEREAHALAGVSAGAYGAASIAIEHRDYFGAVATVAGALNLRYYNADEVYFENFDPATYRWQNRYIPNEVIGSYYHGLLQLRAKRFMEPVFGGGDIVPLLAQTNPADRLFTSSILPGELAIYANYGGRDNFNFDAQVESFAWLASTKGIAVTLDRDPKGTHSFRSLRANIQRTLLWLGQHILPPSAELVPSSPVGH